MIANILFAIKNKITSHTDTVWSGFDSVEIFMIELNDNIENIQLCNFNTLDKVNVEFAVTSTYQELSTSNDWSDDYLKLAHEFDSVYNRLTKAKDKIEQNPWWKLW